MSRLPDAGGAPLIPHELDKVTVTGHYDDDGACRQIFVYLNTDYVTAADVADAVRAVFRPDVAQRDHSLGGTKAFPLVGLNGHSIAPTPQRADSEWFKQ